MVHYHRRRKGRYNMEIMITEPAAAKIGEKTNDDKGFLKLKYDIEGCGCAVDGVFALWFVPELEDDDMAIETNAQTIYVEKAKTVFFDEKMKLDYSETTNWFKLSSDQQILNGQMSLITKKAD
jgi:uncharacterized protein YqkB